MIERNRNLQDHFPVPVEMMIIGVIVLVVIHTFVEELVLLFHWSHRAYISVLIAGFLFDLFFSGEFVARAIYTARKGHLWHYIFSQRGWIDFLSSFPLLLLVSGPAMVLLLMGHENESLTMEYFHVLKTAKGIRVTRVLRLMRVIKLFGKIQNTESEMTNRHVGTVSTIAVVSLVVVMGVVQFIPFVSYGDHGHYKDVRSKELSLLFSGRDGRGAPDTEWIQRVLREDPDNEDVIKITDSRGDVFYESPQSKRLIWSSYPDKKIPIGDGYFLSLSYHPADREHAKVNLILLLGIQAIIFSFVAFYSRIFAQQVADPIYVMDKGIRMWDYNLEVKIHPGHREEEVYRLARAYNARWLPLKNRIRQKRGAQDHGKSVLKMDDMNLF